jgi:hypothetical protein
MNREITAGWSINWQTRWSHPRGNNPQQVVPCSWQTTLSRELRTRPVIAAGDQDPLAEQFGLQLAAGRLVHGPGQPQLARLVAGQGGGEDPVQPPGRVILAMSASTAARSRRVRPRSRRAASSASLRVAFAGGLAEAAGLPGVQGAGVGEQHPPPGAQRVGGGLVPGQPIQLLTTAIQRARQVPNCTKITLRGKLALVSFGGSRASAGSHRFSAIAGADYNR